MAIGTLYNPTLEFVLTSLYGSGTWKAMLVNSSYVVSGSTHDFIDDVSANQVTGAGYTAGGKTLVPTVTRNNTLNTFTVTFPAVTWAASTITARGVVYYQDTGTPSTSRVGLFVDFEANAVSVASDFPLAAASFTLDFPN